MLIPIISVAVLALFFFAIGGMAGADADGRGGDYLLLCWFIAAVLAVVDGVLIGRMVLA